MNCSVKSVEARLYRAKQTLRHAFRDIAPVIPGIPNDDSAKVCVRAHEGSDVGTLGGRP